MNVENQFNVSYPCYPATGIVTVLLITTPDVLALMVLILVILGPNFKCAPLKCLQAFKEHFHIEVKCMFILKAYPLS